MENIQQMNSTPPPELTGMGEREPPAANEVEETVLRWMEQQSDAA